jgi:hypothetical protein
MARHLVWSLIILLGGFAFGQQPQVPMPKGIANKTTLTRTLPCCRCINDDNATLNLNTGQASPIDPVWIVNSGGNAYTTPPSTAWTVSLPPAQWIQPVASPLPSSNVGGGTFRYITQFDVPDCATPMSVRLDGKFASDNGAIVSFDGNQIASCGLNCFGGPPVPFSVANIQPGLHVLEIDVTNQQGSYSGLLVNARVTRQCTRCNRCPYLGRFDSANCFIGTPPKGTSAFIWSNNFYYTPLPGNQCPYPGSWYDGANCFVTTIPSGASPFIWNNAWYVKPEKCGDSGPTTGTTTSTQ